MNSKKVNGSPGIRIRSADASESVAVAALVAAAFEAAHVGEAALVTRLLAEGAAPLTLLAVAEAESSEDPDESPVRPETLVGMVLLSPLTAPCRALGLAPLAVLPAHRRAGVGAALVAACLAWARDAGYQAVFVLGSPAYYGRFGFTAAHAAGFASPYAGPHFMAVPLEGDTMPVADGAVEYHAAFQALD